MHSTSTRRSPNWYTNVALTAIAVLLGLHLIKGSGISLTDSAQAQDGQRDKVTVVGGRPASDDSGAGLISAAEQRKAMISELRSINDRLERVESALARGINVNVKTMPASKDEAKSAPAAGSSTAPAAPTK
jgi:hypothetical protein